MSYCSENRLPLKTPISRLKEVIELLGYIKVKDSMKLGNQIASYMWLGNDIDISFVELELDIYNEKDYISVQTRTRVGRSYWDLKQQNKTISLLKSIFGGTFSTDEGENRYMYRELGNEPSRLECSLYVARWIYENAINKCHIYLQTRELNGDISRNETTGFKWLDSLNPRLLSNNMILPYVIGCWESYFRQSYIAILKYADRINERALKNCRVSQTELLEIIREGKPLESVLADSLSFQRPKVIHENFKQLDNDLDIASCLRKPYHRRKKTLFDSITETINTRDELVHNGSTNLNLYDDNVKIIISDLTEAIDRSYKEFAKVYNFVPRHDF
ncbi:MAG: hypothetical protein IJ423_01495 [Clostridia bacterium]|nr:hypothetical protein [Clostridia bacterium]